MLYLLHAAENKRAHRGLCLRVQAFTTERVTAGTKLLNEKGWIMGRRGSLAILKVLRVLGANSVKLRCLY